MHRTMMGMFLLHLADMVLLALHCYSKFHSFIFR